MNDLTFLIKNGLIEKADIKLFENYVGKKYKITRIKDGLVHYVYKIVGRQQTLYLKIRSKRFSGIPSIKTEPGLIRYEAKALKLFSFYFPTIFPKVIAFNKKRNYLLLTDISRGNSCFEKKLNKNWVKETDFYFLGKTIKKIHLATKNLNISIRGKIKDERFREKQMFYLLGFLNHPQLNKIILSYRQVPKNLILGDLSPKNLYVEKDYLGICDLEHACRGHYLFELAHLIGHGIVHTLKNSKRKKLINSLISGYGGLNFPLLQQEILTYTAVGIVLYRLASPVVPYNLPFTQTEKENFTSLFLRILDTRRLSLERILKILEREI